MKNKTIKKVAAVLTGMLLAVSLSACGSQGGSRNNASQARGEQQDAAPKTTQEAVVSPKETQTAQETQPETTQETQLPTEADTQLQTETVDQTPAEEPSAEEPSAEGGRTLVVYYSATGNTENVAGYIAAATDADIFVLEPVEPYSSDDLDWTNADSRVSREHENESERDVELVSTTVDNWESYDTVFIGYPIWWHIAAWPVDGFVEANDFTGKTVIPFCTSSSSDLGDSGKLLAEAAGTGNWLEGERFSSSASEETVRAWVEGLDLQQ